MRSMNTNHVIVTLLSAILLSLLSVSQSHPIKSSDDVELTEDLDVAGAGKADYFQLRVVITPNSTVVAVDHKEFVLNSFVGVNLAVLDERNGKLLTHRFFNVANRLWAEQLIDFLDTVKDGRIVILGSQNVSGEIWGKKLQLHLNLLGSRFAKSLRPGEEWAMVVEKGYPVLAEQYKQGSCVDIQINVDNKFEDSTGDTCRKLFTNGHMDEFKQWHPDGCRMHQYTSAETQSCLRRVAAKGGRTHIALTGDSRIFSLFFVLMQFVDPEHDVDNTKWQSTYTNKQAETLIEFDYNFYINESMIDYFNRWKTQQDPPGLIVAGSGTWTAREFNGTALGVQEYSRNLTLLVPAINDLARKNTKVIWTLQKPTIPERLWGKIRYFLSNENLFFYNDAAIKTLRGSPAIIWSSIRRIADGNLNECVDGVHHGQIQLIQEAQILLNLHCNEHMDWGDNTCCTKSVHKNQVHP